MAEYLILRRDGAEVGRCEFSTNETMRFAELVSWLMDCGCELEGAESLARSFRTVRV